MSIEGMLWGAAAALMLALLAVGFLTGTWWPAAVLLGASVAVIAIAFITLW